MPLLGESNMCGVGEKIKTTKKNNVEMNFPPSNSISRTLSLMGSYNKLGEHWLEVDAKCYPHEELSSINNQDVKYGEGVGVE